jgi:protein-tyrosine-phosphatase
MTTEKVKILMVCLGNICRSPTAEVVFKEKAQLEKLEDYIEVESSPLAMVGPDLKIVLIYGNTRQF